MKKPSIASILKATATNTLIKRCSGATTQDLARAAADLKIKLPASYAEFVQACGSLDIAGSVVLGIGKSVPKIDSALNVTKAERTSGFFPLPAHLLAIYKVGNGDLECLDCSRIADGDCPVVLWEHDHPDAEHQRPSLVKRTFTNWLAALVKAAPAIETPTKSSQKKHPIDDVIAAIKANPKIKCHAPAREEDIREALLFAGFRLPSSYIKYVSHCGWLSIGRMNILGLGPSIPESRSSASIRHKGVCYWELNHGLYPISKAPNGDLLCLNCKKIKNGDCPVVHWKRRIPNPDLQRPRIIKRTFTAWLAEQVKNAPKPKRKKSP